mgnify:CR=1 FL=1
MDARGVRAQSMRPYIHSATMKIASATRGMASVYGLAMAYAMSRATP